MFKLPKKIAVVHDFLYCYGGAERVLEQILNVFPEADLFSLFDFLPPGQRDFIQNKPVSTSFIQRLPFARTRHRAYLALMPVAIEQLDVSKYDLVISSSYVAAKGVLIRPDQVHICYCHSPVRFAWDLQHQYLSEAGLTRGFRSTFARAILHYIRTWDTRTAHSVDAFITNSHFVSRRVRKLYRRESTPIYPPVDLEAFEPAGTKEDFYLTASRLVPYKRVGLIVDAFTAMPDKRLVVIGDGPEYARIAASAGPNVRVLGHQSSASLVSHMQRAKAFVFAAEEDFGIVAVEAQACGTPVIAYGRGGALETVIDGLTGRLFPEQSAASIVEAVESFEASDGDWDGATIRGHAERFSAGRFRREFRDFVVAEWARFHAVPNRKHATAVNVVDEHLERDAQSWSIEVPAA